MNDGSLSSGDNVKITDVFSMTTLRLPSFWEQLRFGISRYWQVSWIGVKDSKVREIEWAHPHTQKRRLFRRGPTRFSRWRRVS